MLGGGLVLAFPVVGKRFLMYAPSETSFTPNAFLRITADNQVTVILSKVEMGQGVWTTLPMLLAEELDCDLSAIKIEHSPAAKEYIHTFIPIQCTVGSTSTISEYDRYRHAGATAKAMLVAAAARKWGIPSDRCKTENGFVYVGERRISYGALSGDAALLPVPEVKLKEPKDWKIIGKSQLRLDGETKINGTAVYGIDFDAPGLLTALLLRPPVFNGKVKSFDATKAKKIPGVRKVVETSKGIAVIGDNFWSAKMGRDALVVEWEFDIKMQVDSVKQLQAYQQLAKSKGTPTYEKGNAELALTGASKIMEAEFWLPYLAHAMMEPLNCSVMISGNSCEIWTGTQMPGIEQEAAAKILQIDPGNIKVHTLFLGGGFGRRGSLNADFVSEAVEIAKISGEFIKHIWTREDDIKGGYYRPSYLHKVRIGLNHGLPVAWEHRIVGQGVFRNTFVMPDPGAIDSSSVEGVKDSPYFKNIPDYSVQLHTTELNVPVLPWRSVGKSHTCFVMETLVDEIAHSEKKDPLEFRKQLLKDNPRYLTVLEMVEEKSDWKNPATKGISRGVSVYEGNGSYIAYVAEVSVDKGKIRVHRVVCAVDCGLVVNPDGVVAQMEGSIVFGLTAALYGEITLSNGKVQQSNFHDYKMLKLNEMPLVEVYIIESTGQIGGAGEPGVPGIAPALTNAIYAATKKRIRKLPVRNF